MSVYGIGGILTKTINFLLLPVYTRILTPSDYGALELVYLVGNIIAILYGFMISSGYVRHYYDNKRVEYRERLLGTTLWFVLLNSLVFLVVFIVFADQVAAFMFRFPNGGLFIKLVSISTCLIALNQVFYNSLMVTEKAKTYVSINILALLTTLLLTITFVVFLKWNVKGILYAQITGRTLELMLLVFTQFNKKLFVFSFSMVKEMLRFSLPLIPSQLTFFVLTVSDRFFIQHYQGVYDVGLYSLGYRFASIMPLFAITPLKAWGPYIFSFVDDFQQCQSTIARFSRLYMFGVLALCLGISLMGRDVIEIMAKNEFWNAWQVVFLLCLGYVFWGMVTVTSYAFHITKKTWLMSKIEMFVAVCSFLLNFLLVPRLGIVGAAIVNVTSYLMILLIYFVFIHKIYPVQFEYGKMGIAVVYVIGIYFLSLQINLQVIYSILINILLFLLFIFLMYFSKYFSRDELNTVKPFLMGIIKATRINYKNIT